MRGRLGALGLVLSVALVSIALPAQAQSGATGPKTISDADEAYPKTYVCKDLKYNEYNEKPGLCAGDKTPLVLIRLGTAYKCLRGPANFQATEGRCETDGSDKKPVTASVFWTCAAEPAKTFTDPGTCADKSPRLIQFEERPHGDHNPRHGGGAINMSPDLFHHIEATYVAPGLFRVYFYNEFTKPMKVAAFTGTVALENKNFQAPGALIPLTPAKIADGNALEAVIPNAPVPTQGAPVFFQLLIKLKPGPENWRTDQTFLAYTKDPAPPAPTASTGAAARGTAPKATTPAATPAKPAPPKPAPPKVAAAPKAAPKPVAAAPAQESGPAQTTAMSGGAEIGGGATQPLEALPDSQPELLAMLKDKAENVTKLLGEGQMGGVWYPAITAKDVALALEANHEDGLSPDQKSQMASSVKQLTVTAWAIDAAGDLGNGQQLQQLNDQFQAAVAEIMKVYGR